MMGCGDLDDQLVKLVSKSNRIESGEILETSGSDDYLSSRLLQKQNYLVFLQNVHKLSLKTY
ncbi:hypothetical protein Hanom_Chr01g00094021 [Helianthus anomalus]